MAIPWVPAPFWYGQTVVVIASGPSLSYAQLELVEASGKPTIAVSDVYRVAPWADVVYACDLKWWLHHWQNVYHHGAAHKVTCDGSVAFPIRHLRNTGEQGFDPTPGYIRTGGNSGYQAVHLAVHLGAKKIVLLGFDMKPGPDGVQLFLW